MSKLDTAAFMAGNQAEVAAWAAFLANVPMSWVQQ